MLKYNSENQYEVYSVGKVDNRTRQRTTLNDALKEHWQDCIQEPPPSWYHYKVNNAEGRPDLWIEPNKSVILQIRATDLVPSSAFALVKSLHFPRVEMWRNDKLWNECLSLHDYMAMIQVCLLCYYNYKKKVLSLYLGGTRYQKNYQTQS